MRLIRIEIQFIESAQLPSVFIVFHVTHIIRGEFCKAYEPVVMVILKNYSLILKIIMRRLPDKYTL